MSEEKDTPEEPEDKEMPEQTKSIEEICAEIDKEAGEFLDWLATW